MGKIIKNYFHIYRSPIGPLCLSLDDQLNLNRLNFSDFSSHYPPGSLIQDKSIFTFLTEQLDEYFSGKRKKFDVKMELSGTPFQKTVWTALLSVPYGHVTTYGEIAGRIKKHSAARAVGTAVGSNPVAIIVPCHRIIPASGGIGNYGGGRDRKSYLLEREKISG